MKNNSNSIDPVVTTNESDYKYTISNWQVTILEYIGNDSDITIPNTISGYPVTIIGKGAFFNNTELKTISLSSVINIDAKAFAECISLERVSGEYLQKIGDYGFYNCKALSDISFSQVISLGEYCFSNCTSLKTVSLPLVSEIPPKLFSKCVALKTINAANIKAIGSFAFENCQALDELSFLNALSVDSGAFCYSGIKVIDLPHATTIGQDVFLTCSFLDKVNLQSATTIGDYAFMNSSAECICLSSGISQIGSAVFSDAPIRCLTIDYGTEDIASLSSDDWDAFATQLTGLNVDNIVGRYIKNDVYSLNFSKGDTEGPVITLLGANPMTLEVGLSSYTEPGAKVTDNSCESISLVISGVVNTSKIGQYTVCYTATDFSGNRSEVNRIVNVRDTKPPVITLVGPSVITIEVGTPYEELGADVSDNSGERIVPVLSGIVDYSCVGQYTRTYNATDSSGNKATQLVRTVIVTEPSILPCCQIVAYSRYEHIIHWELHKTTGELIYRSGDIPLLQEWICHLDTLGLEAGTLFYLKAVLPNASDLYSETLEYQPKSNTVYYRILISWSLEFSGIVDSYQSPPVLNCVEIECNSQDLDAAFTWDVLTLDDILIYSTDHTSGTSTRWINLSALKIDPGTKIKLKANVNGGDDSYLYLYFEYMPGYTEVPTVTAYGTFFKTCIMYYGIKDSD